MKKILLFATAIAALASCADESFVGDEGLRQANEQTEKAIVFGTGVNAVTRADKTGATAAADLNNTFYVYGIKKESVDGAGNVQDGNLVFKNYVVKWTNNTAFTTTSNTENWEYVGYTLSTKEQANVTANSGNVAQTIKYWDFGAADYTFYAFSALPDDIENYKVIVVKNQTVTGTGKEYDNGYTVTLAADADLDHLFFSERVPIAQSSNTDRTKDNTYGGNVTFRFHKMSAKVRVAMYETIPGYTVTIDKFFTANSADPAFSAMTTENTANFAANFQNVSTGTAGTMTVKYQSTGATQNHPTVSFSATPANVLTLGDQLAANVTIGETVTAPTFDAEKAYTSVFPKEDNTQNLKLKLTYTLTAPVTGETIVVSDATAEIPAQYLTWKPGYAYTYIFKITDDKLYPITFDAVEVVDEDGVQETITTVAEPSITTYTKESNVLTDNEYKTGSNIYVVVDEAATVQTLTVGANANLYLVTNNTGTGTEQEITEKSVENALAHGTATDTNSDSKNDTWTVTGAGMKSLIVTTIDVPTLTATTEIAANDSPTGVAITINGAKFTPTAAGNYVFEYIKAPVAATYKAATGTYVAGTTYYTDNTGATTVDTSSFEAGVTDVSSYFVVDNAGTPELKHYKVIKVVAAP